MVGLMMRVMCAKLGKDVPKLRDCPKLEFSSQNKIGSKGNKNKGGFGENYGSTASAHPNMYMNKSKNKGYGNNAQINS